MERAQWADLVRTKLVPAHYVIPVATGLHEWSKEYRDLLFEMADFLRVTHLSEPSELAREFARQSHSAASRDFSLDEIELLLGKVGEYQLTAIGPVRK